jgi:hypothetical protein
MKRKSTLIVFSTFLFFGLFAANLFAQDKQIAPDKQVVQEQPRVIEEEIVLSDPTVAQPQKWLIGGSSELWYVWKNWIRWDNEQVYSSGKINGSMPGGTIYAGYDNFAISYSYRRGSWDGSSDTSDVPGATATLSQDQTEHEITGRWLFKVSKHFNPYVLVGYNHLVRTETMTVDVGHPFSYNSSQVSNSERTYKSPLIGLGAIIPFNKYIGLRADCRLMYSWAEWKRDDGFSLTKTDFGGAVVGTLYWNIWQGLNAQIGWKYQRLGLDEGGELGATSKTGVFGMLGYTFKL